MITKNFTTLLLVAMVFSLLAATVHAEADVEAFNDKVSITGEDIVLEHHRGEEFTATIKITDSENRSDLRLELDSVVRNEYDIRIEDEAKTSHEIVLDSDNSTSIDFRVTIPSRKDAGAKELIKDGALKLFEGTTELKSFNLFYESPNMLNVWVDEIRAEGRRTTTVAPLESVEIRVMVENLHELTIEDIFVELVIENFEDEGSYDLEEFEEIRSIRPGRDSRVTFTFTVPYDVYEDMYDIRVFVDGEDRERAIHEAELATSEFIDVRRNRNELYANSMSLSRSTLSCETPRTNLELEILNIGSRRLEDVSVVIRNDELDILEETRGLELESYEYDDRDSRYYDSYVLNIPEDTEPGNYFIGVNVNVAGTTFIREEFEVEVTECPKEEEEEQQTDEGSIIVEERPREEHIIIDPEPVQEPVSEQDNTNIYIALLAVMNVVLLAGVIALLYTVTRSRKYW